MHLAVQLAVNIEVAHILERVAARAALEALGVQALVVDATEDAHDQAATVAAHVDGAVGLSGTLDGHRCVHVLDR